MAKMFYTLEETAQRLGISADEVKALGSDGDLQVFRDRDKMMFKRDQVDSLAEERGDPRMASGASDTAIPLEDTGGSGTAELQAVSGGDSAAGSGIPGSPADSAGPGDSGVPSGSGIAMVDDARDESGMLGDSGEGSGINVFEGDDLESADSGAQTQMTGPEESGDELVLESIGSGSGLLDLTREEDDDTSVGEDLLEEIGLGDSGAETKVGSMPGSSGALDSALGAEASGQLAGLAGGEPAAAGIAPAAESVDPASSGLVIGLLVAATAWLIIAMFVAFYAIAGVSMRLTTSIGENLLMYTVIGLGVSGVLGVVGFAIGKMKDK